MKPRHRLPCLLSSMVFVLALGTGHARAADVPASAAGSSTRQAMENLLTTLPPTAQADDAARVRVTARRGETVDGIIRRTMGDLPFKEAFLRGVFLEINASAVQPGTMRLVAGAQLQVPNLSDLRSHLQRVLDMPASAGRPAEAASAPSPADKRHWVRFP